MRKIIYFLGCLFIYAPFCTLAQQQLKQGAVSVGMDSLFMARPTSNAIGFKLMTQPMSVQPVLGLSVNAVNGENAVTVFQDFKSKADGLFAVNFFLKMIPRTGVAEVELQYLDSKGEYRKLSALHIDQKGKSIYNLWVQYSISYDESKYENKAGSAYRLVFNLIRDDLGRGNGLLKDHQNCSFFITGIKSVPVAYPKLSNSKFELWDAKEWPAKPIDWRLLEGNGCLERFRGHLLDDYALRLVNPDGKPMRMESIGTLPLKIKKYTLQFYARTEQNGQELELVLNGLKQKKSFKLDKTWRRYAMDITGADTSEKLEWRYSNSGAVYIDEIEVISVK